MLVSKNFHKRELHCKCCGEFDIYQIAIETLQKTRDLLDEPMIVSSGQRCQSHNKSVGGADMSYHLSPCRGFDILATKSKYRYRLIRAAILAGFTGIKVYPSHVHLDIRPTTGDFMV